MWTGELTGEWTGEWTGDCTGDWTGDELVISADAPGTTSSRFNAAFVTLSIFIVLSESSLNSPVNLGTVNKRNKTRKM